MSQINRRNLLLSAAALSLPATVGCSGNQVQETLDGIDTDTMESAAVALKGYALVSCLIGPRVFALPAPGVRVLAVFLVVSGVATKLAIEYLDVELRKRYVAEALTDEEIKVIETDLAVTFQLENGNTEKTLLGPNQYDTESPA
ncbi:MAG: hypothetical protein HKN47_19865 [Pirellulaceae bacterium]|nr:hypothetical protein [Pirellulaceae bacterium]